jgi:hypothetical protein
VTSPLRSARLRRIIFAYAVNRVGTWIGLVALMVAVFDHTHSALAVSALLLAAQVVAAVAVPALVARVETSRRRGELSALYVFEGVATAILAVLLGHFSLVPILALVALDGTAALAAGALLRAEVVRAAREDVEAKDVAGAVSERLEKERAGDRESEVERAERKANAALNVAFSATFVTGPVIAGVIVASAGASTALFVDAASFLICGALLTDLRPRIEEASGESIRDRLRAAWGHMSQSGSLRTLLLVEAVAIVFFETAAPIEVTYAKATLHAGDRGFGLLLTTWGAGSVLGSLIFARSMRRPLPMLLSFGTLGVGVGYAGFSIAPTLPFACVSALVGGIGNGVELPSLFSLIQRLTPKSLHNQLMGAVETIGAVCPAIGLPLGGALVVLTTPRTAFVVVGSGTIAAAIALFRAGRSRPVVGEEQLSVAEVPPGNVGVPSPPEPAAR